ncbi:MAG TPA: hypothetical protein VMZ52_02225 [Bryobacteraceae bacterium]|nr:hypothetical protein [Bryobacteraceae bacterium]
MSDWPSPAADAPVLSGAEGELVSIRINIDPKQLEELLDCLAQVSFPINPQIYHAKPTSVEFPAYAKRLHEVTEALRLYGLSSIPLQVSPMLRAISAA